jgi:hypothetical protein
VTEADRWRACNHPHLEKVRTPDVLPTVRSAGRPSLGWVITPRMVNPPIIHRCNTCGQVGEKAVNGG